VTKSYMCVTMKSDRSRVFIESTASFTLSLSENLLRTRRWGARTGVSNLSLTRGFHGSIERGIEEVEKEKEVEKKKIDGHPLLCFFGASLPCTFLPNQQRGKSCISRAARFQCMHFAKFRWMVRDQVEGQGRGRRRYCFASVGAMTSLHDDGL
jgi:hypothetical protein